MNRAKLDIVKMDLTDAERGGVDAARIGRYIHIWERLKRVPKRGWISILKLADELALDIRTVRRDCYGFHAANLIDLKTEHGESKESIRMIVRVRPED